MPNVFGSPKKKRYKVQLLAIAIQALESDGWTVERTRGGSSTRLIRKDRESYRISIRTSQDQWIAFPRNSDDSGWVTLSDVDVVLAVTVDDSRNPTEARVYWIEGDEMRARFDRAYRTRLDAGHDIPLGQGMWIPLYLPEDGTPTHAGGGAGLDHEPMAVVPLVNQSGALGANGGGSIAGRFPSAVATRAGDSSLRDDPLTIAEAKRRLALSLGVREESIKITVEA